MAVCLAEWGFSGYCHWLALILEISGQELLFYKQVIALKVFFFFQLKSESENMGNKAAKPLSSCIGITLVYYLVPELGHC